MATIGQVGNLDHENVTIGKAGRSRWLGKRPHNRGVSMNRSTIRMGRGRQDVGWTASGDTVGATDSRLQDAE